MSSKKLKLTGFARFLIAMVFIIPLAYIGASYYNGEDGVENIKNLIGINGESSAVKSTSSSNDESTPSTASEEYVNSQVKMMRDELAEKDARVEKAIIR